MTAVGGSIQDISVDGRLFPVSADSDSNLFRGGFTAEVVANGDGSARKILTRNPWGIDGLNVEIDHDRADLEFLEARAALPGFVDITITFIDGTTFQGSGSPVDEQKFASQASTMPVSFMGPGNATQQ